MLLFGTEDERENVLAPHPASKSLDGIQLVADRQTVQVESYSGFIKAHGKSVEKSD